MKKRHIALTVALALLFSAVTFNVGIYIGEKSGKLNFLETIIKEYFALDYDVKAMEDLAAKGMVYALGDPYSEYMTVEESVLFNESMSGYYKGIGVNLNYNNDTDEIYVKGVEKGGPSDIAGIKEGDILIYVDEIEVNFENYDRIFYYIKGISEDAPDDDTEMTIRVLRDGEELEFSVKRTELMYDNVETELTDGVLYVKLAEFSESAVSETKKEIEANKDFDAIILDLRDNGGGDINSLIGMAELLLPEGLLLTTENADGGRREYFVEDNDYYDVPLAVLVNGNTASASEVLTAAIKENERGCVIGETTYGKGLVQGIIPLGDGSYLRLTIEKYYTAKGNYINEVGVIPDIEIADEEKQMAKAIEYVKSEIK